MKHLFENIVKSVYLDKKSYARFIMFMHRILNFLFSIERLVANLEIDVSITALIS